MIDKKSELNKNVVAQRRMCGSYIEKPILERFGAASHQITYNNHFIFN
jgi:hypothetical protein